MRQIGGFATFCCWLAASGAGIAVLYALWLAGGTRSGSLFELGLVAAGSVVILSLAAFSIQRELGGVAGFFPIVLMTGGAALAAFSLGARSLIGALERGSRGGPDAFMAFLILGPLAIWLLFAGAIARRSYSWGRDLVTLAFVSGAGLGIVLVAALMNSVALGVVGALISGCLSAFLFLVAWRYGNAVAARPITLGIGLAVVLIVGGANAQARSALSARESAWQAEVAAERSRVASLKMPVLRGDAQGCNAYEGYQAAMAATTTLNGLISSLSLATAAGPFAEIPGEVRSAVEAQAPLIQRFRDGSRCARVDMGLRYDDERQPSLLPARIAANLTMIAGHKAAQAKDPASAAGHYEDAARFGADLESQGGSLILSLLGVAIRDSAMRSLGTLVVSADLDSSTRAEISEAVRRLASAPPSVTNGLLGERLLVLPNFRGGVFARSAGLSLPILNAVAGRPLSLRLLEVEGFYRETAEAVDEADFTKASARIKDIDARVRGAWPRGLMSAFVPSGGRLRTQVDRAKAHGALVGAALLVEESRGKAPHYPAEVQGLPADPFMPGATLRYAITGGGAGYKVWSPGPERKDHGGNGQWLQNNDTGDILLERKPGVVRP